MSLIMDELVRAVRTAVPCRRNASARRAENVLLLYRCCRMAVRAVLRVFICVACPGRSGRPARIPGIVTGGLGGDLLGEAAFRGSARAVGELRLRVAASCLHHHSLWRLPRLWQWGRCWS
jgi:hypothetical protein